MRAGFVGLALVGCGGDRVEVPPPGATEITWYADIEPLVREHCIRCHEPGGQGPGDFSDYQVAKAQSPAMASRIAAGEMPPPAADLDCEEYEGADRMVLDDEEQALFQAWVDAGSPEGDVADQQSDPYVPRTLTDADRTTMLKAPYSPDWVDGNEYRCFVLDAGFDETTFITAFEPLVDNDAIAHHTVLFYDASGTAGQNVTDAATDSWHCPTVSVGGWPTIHAWAPGNNVVDFGDGGIRIAAGGKLVLQMHYFENDGAAPTDQSGYRLKTATSVGTEVFMLPLGPDDFLIPAGDDAYSQQATYGLSMMGMGGGVTIYGVFPHMHALGAGYHFWTEKPNGGERCISRADRYDFNNQPTYQFVEPIQANNVIGVECTWNNSGSNPNQIIDPPVDTTWGENTQQEMCYALLYASF